MNDFTNVILSVVNSPSENEEIKNYSSDKDTGELYNEKDTANKKKYFIKDISEDIVTTKTALGNLTNIKQEKLVDIAGRVYQKAVASTSLVSNSISNTADSVSSSVSIGVSKVGSSVREATSNENMQKAYNIVNPIAGKLSDSFDNVSETVSTALDSMGESLQDIAEYIPTNSVVGSTLQGIVKTIGKNMKKYQDGISETDFGSYMNESWAGSSNSFLNYFQSQNKGLIENNATKKVAILNSTPLDSQKRSNLFGSVMLGCPLLFNEYSDPSNRSLINAFVKDGTFVSFTPGMPKYNGTKYTQGDNNILNQTGNGSQMLSYLLKNGIDSNFKEKDKRYYTFQTKFSEYFAYLEAMLNPIWIKLGLANSGDDNTFNIFSFFEINDSPENGEINPNNFEKLIEQYNTPIGFFINPNGSLSEDISSTNTGFGGGLASTVNANAEEYQRINYLTGMGTGSSMQNTSRQIANTYTGAKQMIDFVKSSMSTALYGGSKMFNLR